MRPWLAFATTISASLMAAVIVTEVTGWGGDDLEAFVSWAFPFGGLIALATRLAGPRIARLRRPLPVAVAAGAIGGFLWTLLVALLLGPYFLAFGFPVVVGWMAGGSAGLAAGTALRSAGALRVARVGAYGTIGLVVLFVVITAVLSQFLWGPDLVAHLRSGTPDAQASAFAESLVGQNAVVGVTQNDPLVLEIDLVDDVTDDERRRLRAILERSPLVDRVEE